VSHAEAHALYNLDAYYSYDTRKVSLFDPFADKPPVYGFA